MSNLVPQANKWNDDINQVETTDSIIGGANGNANLATRQLAENILWLRQNMQSYKVGDVYTTTLAHANAAAVSAHHGYGTWERYAEGRTLVGYSTKTTDPADYKTMGNEFGENEVTLTEPQMPIHVHKLSKGIDDTVGNTAGAVASDSNVLSENYLDENSVGAAGGGEAHNNIQPSKVIGQWLRTA